MKATGALLELNSRLTNINQKR